MDTNNGSTCVACEYSEPLTERFGLSWCPEHLATIDFEERLAQRQGASLVEVAVRDGSPVFIYGDPVNKKKMISIEGIELTRTDVLDEFLETSRALVDSVLWAGGRVVGVSTNTIPLQHRLDDLLAKNGPLLGPADQKFLSAVTQAVDAVAAFLKRLRR
jgi:hypothetical protein